ncbi:hypothetical protein GA0070607_2805 [Micromonospora coriariae]|uniref:Flp pilus-assembly TadE/G-like n=1 Tax=Micromonospora coriariae TaxID=285665 RepID=A0A1C4VXQ1_9ACTN|nr:hypothetical protein [Micromonospora coriariae]SCE88571.1 hypothetical protein GA0070607_2805 [Micromonospora coriariae]
MTTRRPVRRSRTPVVLAVVLGLALVGVVVAIEVGTRRMAADSRAEEAGAEAAVTRDAQAYAAEVVATGDPAPTDDRLAAVADGTGVQVREVRRRPDLSVIVYGTARFGTMFGAGNVAACHRVTFHALGTAAAGSVVERLSDCPSAAPGPTPS